MTRILRHTHRVRGEVVPVQRRHEPMGFGISEWQSRRAEMSNSQRHFRLAILDLFRASCFKFTMMAISPWLGTLPLPQSYQTPFRPGDPDRPDRLESPRNRPAAVALTLCSYCGVKETDTPTAWVSRSKTSDRNVRSPSRKAHKTSVGMPA